MRARIPAPFGSVTVRAQDAGHVVSVELAASREDLEVPEGFPGSIVRAFEAYLSGAEEGVDVPVGDLGVTRFQQAVLQEASRVAPGGTVTYGDVAKRVDREGGALAVGQALAANPVPLVVPCHRVVSATGLGGFMGETAGKARGIKRWLLEHEGAKRAWASTGVRRPPREQR